MSDEPERAGVARRRMIDTVRRTGHLAWCGCCAAMLTALEQEPDPASTLRLLKLLMERATKARREGPA